MFPVSAVILERIAQYKTMLDLPDARLNLLLKFLQQNEGCLSKRALEKEFAKLTPEEVEQIEQLYANELL